MTSPFTTRPGQTLALPQIPVSQTAAGATPGLVLGSFDNFGVVDLVSADIGGGVLACQGIMPIDSTNIVKCSGVTIEGDILFREETDVRGRWDIRVVVQQRNTGTDALEIEAERTWEDVGQLYGWRRLHDFTDLTVPFSGFASDVIIYLRYVFVSDFSRQTSPTNVLHAVQMPRLTVRKLTIHNDGAQTARALRSPLPVPSYKTVARELPESDWQAEIGYGHADPPIATSDEDWDVSVNSVAIWDGSVSTDLVAGWTTLTAITTTDTGVRTSVSFDISPDLSGSTSIPPNAAGEYTVTISSPTLVESYSWTFSITSIDNLNVISGTLLDPYRLEVSFTDDVDLSETALNPRSYSMQPVSPPAFVPLGQTAVSTGLKTVEITFDEPVTMQADYTLEVSRELEANEGLKLDEDERTWALKPSLYTAGFRNIDMFQNFPLFIRCEDVKYGDNTKVLSGVIDDALKYLYLKNEEQLAFADPTTAPVDHLDILLDDYGNFFNFDMTEDEKRRLIQELGYFQELVGDQKGIEGAIRFFTGIDMTVLTVYDEDVWVLNQDPLNDGTIIALGLDSPDWLTYDLELPAGVGLDDVTDQDRLRISVITRVMEPSYALFRDIVE